MQYFLAPHVHLCVTDDHAVLLDLKRDKYVGVSAAQMDSLAAWIHGWPARHRFATPGEEDERPPARGRLLDSMVESQMLTTDPRIGRPARPFNMTEPHATVLEADLEARSDATFKDVLQFIFSTLIAKLIFRYRPIEKVVARVRSRKARRAGAGYSADIDRTRRRVEAFMYLRPLLFRAHDRCLFDSFALTEFLARDGIFPSMVFGVKTGPFGAHCWVQDEGIVLNDTPDYVRRFTPILAV